MTQIKESDFQLVEKEQNDFLSIKIKKGSYKNVIYTYGKVSINEDKENDVATLKFSYNIEETPKKWTKEQLDDSVKFRNHIGGILAWMLENYGDGAFDEQLETDTKKDM